MRAFDGVAQSEYCGFGGKALAPLVFRKTPADFHFRSAIEFERLQAAVADNAAVGFAKQFPKAKPARTKMILLARKKLENLTVSSRTATVDVTHDVGVGKDRAGGCEVGGRPWSEPEAFGFEVMIHSTDSNSLVKNSTVDFFATMRPPRKETADSSSDAGRILARNDGSWPDERAACLAA